MCRRRLLKSNFYINYGGTKKAHGETVIVSPFVAGGHMVRLLLSHHLLLEVENLDLNSIPEILGP